MRMDRFNEFQEACKRTGYRPSDDAAKDTVAVVTMFLGLGGEAGEVCDLGKKIYGHGHPRDREKMCEELGDVLFYVSEIARIFGWSLSEVADANVRKLQRRFPDGFSTEASIARVDAR